MLAGGKAVLLRFNFNIMKKLSLFIAILLISYSGFSQSLTGLWNGTFTNDSTTLRADQPFEIALTEYKGKVYGYSRREFIKNDTLYYVLKRVKGKIDGDLCEVTEDEFISHNFPTIDKGVKITYTFHFNKNDSSWSLDGKWKTNRVVKRKYEYYSLTGNVGMIIEKDLSKSKLFPHLAELKLDEDVPFYASYKKELKIEEEQKNIAASRKKSDEAKKIAENNKPKELPKQEPVVTTPKDVAKTTTEPEKKKEEKISVKPETTTPAPKTDVVKTNPDNNKPKEQPKQEPVTIVPKDVAKKNTEPEKKKEEVTVKKDTPVVATDVVAAKPREKTELPPKPTAAVNVERRKSETIQSIEFKSDSLTLALYDNGEIDGDTVSVLINGEVVMPKQGLKASAIKKTIYITPAMQDSFTLVLYAENLGLYPPNTGLIIVRDGDDSYQVRFSADLQKNVAVLFKRKKK
jgi:hypothetical protein